jgi:hypothetical protein
MIIAKKFHIPDRCPENCPFKEQYKRFVMGDACKSCPVFLCRVVTYEGEIINLVPAESFDAVSAGKWEKWFKEGMRKAPPARRRLPAEMNVFVRSGGR